MRKLIIAICILLAPVIAEARGLMMVGGGVSAAAGCTTPDNGDVLDDALATGEGGDAVTWTAGGSGGTCAQDQTLTGTPPTASCAKGFAFNSTGTNTCGEYWDNGGLIDPDATEVDVIADIYIDSTSNLPAYGARNMVGLSASTTIKLDKNVIKLKRNNAAEGAPNSVIGQGGASTTSSVAINTNTWYTIKMHIDATAGETCDTNCINPDTGSSGCSYIQVSTDGTPDTETKYCFNRSADDFRYVWVLAAGENAVDVIKGEIGYVSVNTP